jgi:hypothetical protein
VMIILGRKLNIELLFWLTALIGLAITNPAADTHLVICPVKLLGFNWCPGCGIGHAISFLFHGQIETSIKFHALGIPALIIILNRIYALINLQFFNLNKF